MLTIELNALHTILEIQGSDGNWNYSAYMHGLYNGLELALASLEHREPNYRDRPERFLCELAGEKQSELKLIEELSTGLTGGIGSITNIIEFKQDKEISKSRDEPNSFYLSR